MKILSASGFEHKVIITGTLAWRMIGSDHRIAYIYLYFFVIVYYCAQNFQSGLNRWPAAALMNNRIGATKTWFNLLKTRKIFSFISLPAVSESGVFGVSLPDQNEEVTV